MKLKNCTIGTAVQSKTTGLTGVVFDIWHDGDDTDVEVHFNSYTADGLKTLRGRVKPEDLRKVKSLGGRGGAERVCIVVNGGGVSVEDALKALRERGYTTQFKDSNFSCASVLYGCSYGKIAWARTMSYHYCNDAQYYRDITNEVVLKKTELFQCSDENWTCGGGGK